MQVVVLAGGRGQRLHPLTARRPKPMLPVMGRPLLGQLLGHLARQPEVDEIVVATGYLGEVIDKYIRGLRLRVPVHTARESEPRGTAGAVVDLLPRLRSPFAVVSGDTVMRLDLAAMLRAHRRMRAAATVCVTEASESTRFGIVEPLLGRVVSFLEKPQVRHLVNCGSYVMEHRALLGWQGQAPLDFGQDVLPRLVADGQVVATSEAARFWTDLGTAESFRRVHLQALTGPWPWGIPASEHPLLAGGEVDMVGPVHFGRNVIVGPHVRLVGPLYVGNDVVIGPDAEVTRSVLLDGCTIGAGAWVQDAVVDVETVLPRSAAASGGIVGSSAGVDGPVVSAREHDEAEIVAAP
jgi:NDP-sugar pyrophosphorylase family protein